jgi:hypothetical protein
MELYSMAVRIAELKLAERDEHLARAMRVREARAGRERRAGYRRWLAATLIAVADRLAPVGSMDDRTSAVTSLRAVTR